MVRKMHKTVILVHIYSIHRKISSHNQCHHMQYFRSHLLTTAHKLLTMHNSV